MIQHALYWEFKAARTSASTIFTPAKCILGSILYKKGNRNFTQVSDNSNIPATVNPAHALTLLPWLENFFTESASPWTRRRSTFSYSAHVVRGHVGYVLYKRRCGSEVHTRAWPIHQLAESSTESLLIFNRIIQKILYFQKTVGLRNAHLENRSSSVQFGHAICSKLINLLDRTWGSAYWVELHWTLNKQVEQLLVQQRWCSFRVPVQQQVTFTGQDNRSFQTGMIHSKTSLERSMY